RDDDGRRVRDLRAPAPRRDPDGVALPGVRAVRGQLVVRIARAGQDPRRLPLRLRDALATAPGAAGPRDRPDSRARAEPTADRPQARRRGRDADREPGQAGRRRRVAAAPSASSSAATMTRAHGGVGTAAATVGCSWQLKCTGTETVVALGMSN